MKCEQCEALGLDYLKGELDQAMGQAMDGHLATCESCRQRHAVLVETWSVLDELPQRQPSARLAARFSAVLAADGAGSADPVPRQPVRDRWFQWLAKPTWAAVYSLVLLFSGVVTGQALPQMALPFLAAGGATVAANGNLDEIPEDSLVQWCSTRNPRYPEI